MPVVDIEMDDIEVIGRLDHLVEHDDVMRERIAAIGVETKTSLRRSMEPGARRRIAGREQRDAMALPNELIGQIGNNAFGAAVEPGGVVDEQLVQ